MDQILSHKKKNDSILSKFSTAPGRTRPLPKRLPKSPPEDSYLTAIPSAKPKTPQDRAMVIVDLDGVSEQHPRGTSPKKFPPPNTYEKRTPRGLQQKPRTSSAISELNGSRQQQGNARRGNQRRFKNNGHGKSNSGRNGNDGVPECVPCLGRNSENSCEDEEIGASANELNIRFAADDLDILETRVSLPSQTMGGAQQSTRSSARISARSSERFRSPELNDPVPRRARDVPRKTLGRQGQTNRSKRKRATQSPDSPEDDDAVQRPTKRTSPAEICVNREWEHAPCIKEYVSERLRTFLEAQRSLISLSFMGITSDDLRSLLEIWWGDETTKEELDFITRIDLSNNNIGSLSDDICTKLSLAPLSGLFLSCNMLTSIAGRLGLMSKLEFLDLSRNKLISLPQEICELKNLKVLDVSRNEIDRLPPSLSLLKDLEVLNASYNKLTCLPDDVATEHSQLFALDLSHNPEFVFFPTCVEYWSQLEDVGIEQTKIERLLPNKDLKDLRRAPAEVLRDIAGRDEKMLKERSSRRIPRSSRGATDVVSL